MAKAGADNFPGKVSGIRPTNFADISEIPATEADWTCVLGAGSVGDEGAANEMEAGSIACEREPPGNRREGRLNFVNSTGIFEVKISDKQRSFNQNSGGKEECLEHDWMNRRALLQPELSGRGIQSDDCQRRSNQGNRVGRKDSHVFRGGRTNWQTGAMEEIMIYRNDSVPEVRRPRDLFRFRLSGCTQPWALWESDLITAAGMGFKKFPN